MSSTSSSSSQSRKGDAATTASTQGKSTSSTATAAARSSGIRKPPPLKRLSDQTQARAKRQSATASAASSAAKSRATGSTASSSSATGTKAKVSTNVSQPTVTRRPGVAVRKVAEKPADVPSVSISGSSTAGHVTASSIAATVDTAAGLSPSVLEFKPYFQELDVLIEYKLVCHYMVREGVYVVPSLKSGRVWHGVICLHAGPFKGGVFRFNIFFPDRFPHEHPMIKFVSYVFHPQVDSNGILNITQAFPHWHAQRDHVWHVLQHMKKVFCSLDTWQPTNEKATIAVHESMDAYNAQAHTCVHQSIQDLLESTGSSDDDGNFLKYFEISDEANAEIKQQIGSQSTLRAVQHGDKELAQLAERFAKMFAKHAAASRTSTSPSSSSSSSSSHATAKSASASVTSSSKKSRTGTHTRSSAAAQKTKRKASAATASSTVAI